MKIKKYIFVLALLSCVLDPAKMSAQAVYTCELGLQAGCGYYVGDATPHIFMNPREAYGLQFRYKFTKRWALQVKASGQRIVGPDYTIKGEKLATEWQNQLINTDVMAEFNFFRFGNANKYDKRIRSYTPYIFLGVGGSLYGADNENKPTFRDVAFYVPLGVGFKWKFSERCGLNIAWQHNIYVADDLESRSTLNNTHHLNGWNWMNCDLTGMLTAAIVVEFAEQKKVCKMCDE